MSDNMASSDSPEEANPENTDQPRNEAEVIASLEHVLAEANRQQDYRRHQVDTSVQLSMQLIGFASLTSPFTALASVQIQWLKYIALFFLFLAVIFGLIDIFNPVRGENELPVGKMRHEACTKSLQSVLLYQIDNKTGNESKARATKTGAFVGLKADTCSWARPCCVPRSLSLITARSLIGHNNYFDYFCA